MPVIMIIFGGLVAFLVLMMVVFILFPNLDRSGLGVDTALASEAVREVVRASEYRVSIARRLCGDVGSLVRVTVSDDDLVVFDKLVEENVIAIRDLLVSGVKSADDVTAFRIHVKILRALNDKFDNNYGVEV